MHTCANARGVPEEPACREGGVGGGIEHSLLPPNPVLPLQFEGSLLIRCLHVLTHWHISSQQHGSLSVSAC